MSDPLFNWECQVEFGDGLRQELLVFGQPHLQDAVNQATNLLAFIDSDGFSDLHLELVSVKRLGRCD